MSKAAPSTDPMTIPAILPPDRLCRIVEAVAVALAALLVADGPEVDVADVNNGGIGKIDGNVTPVQRLVTFEPTQHESVALGELVAQ